MPTLRDVRRFVQTLPDVEERPHFDRIALRARVTFATLDPKGGPLNVKVEPPERQRLLLETMPQVFGPCGGWTKMGWTSVALDEIDRALLEELLLEAWRGAATKRGLATHEAAAAPARPRAQKKTLAAPRRAQRPTAKRSRR